MNLWRRSWFLLVCVLGTSGLAAETKITADVIYGHKDGMALTYDVFQAEQPNGAAVVYMVSGGWFSVWQPPANRVPYFEMLLSEGISVFAVHHGSAPRFKVPDAVSDVRAAVRHIRSNAETYGVDPERLGVWGGSAGGHLSLMLGLNAEAAPGVAAGEGARASRLVPRYIADADSSGRLAAVVAYYPPVDLRTMAGPNKRFPALDFASDAATAISPILFVSDDDPPTMLIHGNADDLVNVSNSEILQASLEETGVTHDLLIIEGGDHGFRNTEHRAEANRAMVAWFKEHLVP